MRAVDTHGNPLIWMEQRGSDYRVYASIHDRGVDLLEEARTWCDATLGHRQHTERWYSIPFGLVIRGQDDALMFRMRWL